VVEKILLDLAEDVIRVNPNRKQEFKEMIIVTDYEYFRWLSEKM
jgi:hypothetical protein